jgi:hypothetical protein
MYLQHASGVSAIEPDWAEVSAALGRGGWRGESAPVELRALAPAFGVGVLVEGDGRRDEGRRDARDDDRRHRPGRAGVGVLEQRDGLQDRRGDALKDALGDFASYHRDFRVGRRARVVLRAVCQPPYLDGGLEAGQHQEKLFQHGKLAAVLGHDDGD